MAGADTRLKSLLPEGVTIDPFVEEYIVDVAGAAATAGMGSEERAEARKTIRETLDPLLDDAKVRVDGKVREELLDRICAHLMGDRPSQTSDCTNARGSGNMLGGSMETRESEIAASSLSKESFSKASNQDINQEEKKGSRRSRRRMRRKQRRAEAENTKEKSEKSAACSNAPTFDNVSSATSLETIFVVSDDGIRSYYNELRTALARDVATGCTEINEASRNLAKVIGNAMLDGGAIERIEDAERLCSALLTSKGGVDDEKPKAGVVWPLAPPVDNGYVIDRKGSKINSLGSATSILDIVAPSNRSWMDMRAKIAAVGNDKTTEELVREEKQKARRDRSAAKRQLKRSSARRKAEQQDARGFAACTVTTRSGKEAKASGFGGGRSPVLLKLEGVEMTYGSGMLLQGSDFSLLRGRRYGLVGRNGVGKSTLLFHLCKLAPEGQSTIFVRQEAEASALTPREVVLQADTVMQELLQKEKELLEQENPDTETLSAVSEELALRGVDTAATRAAAILAGLSFTEKMQNSPTSDLSGGWRMRLSLATALFVKPDLLLLDEPTNHLDLSAVIWLEQELQSWPTTLILVSHDSQFLNEVCTDIVEFAHRRLTSYRGNWDTYVKSASDRYIARKREYDQQQDDIAHKQEFVDKWINNRFGYNAGLVQSRLKELKKMRVGGENHIPKPLPPGKGVKFSFQVPSSKIADPLVNIQRVSFAYPGGRVLFHDLSLKLCAGMRVALVGPNGAGKSTLLKLIVSKRRGGLDPVDGSIVSKGKLRLAWFHQHFVEQLDMDLCPLEEMRKLLGALPKEEVLRRALGRFGVGADLAIRPNRLLSGGQKARCAFAKLAALEPDVFVLDEPTNHLDLESVRALSDALVNFPGACVFVSHDEAFCRNTLTELWHCDGASVSRLHCGFDEYKLRVKRMNGGTDM